MIDQVEQTPINQVDIDLMLSQWPPEEASVPQWPYDGAVSSHILASQSSASLKSPVAPPDGNDQPDIDLKIRLSQYWAGCSSLLISVAPYWLVVNETEVDLVVIDDANGQHWKLAHDVTIAPPEFEVIKILPKVDGFLKFDYSTIYRTEHWFDQSYVSVDLSWRTGHTLFTV